MCPLTKTDYNLMVLMHVNAYVNDYIAASSNPLTVNTLLRIKLSSKVKSHPIVHKGLGIIFGKNV